MPKNKIAKKHLIKCTFVTCDIFFEVYYADEKELLNMPIKMKYCKNHQGYESVFKNVKFQARVKMHTHKAGKTTWRAKNEQR